MKNHTVRTPFDNFKIVLDCSELQKKWKYPEEIVWTQQGSKWCPNQFPVTLARKRCSFSTPENLCYANTGKRGRILTWKIPACQLWMEGKTGILFWQNNDRFLRMKENYLMDPGNPEDRNRIRIFRNEAGRFCDLPEIFVKNGSCNACWSTKKRCLF